MEEDRIKAKARLKEEFDKIAAIFPRSLERAFKECCYFGGGCIYSIYNNLEPKDYDIFCEDMDVLLALKGYLKKTKQAEMITENAFSFGENGKYQLVTKFYGEPLETIGQFDFKHNMFGFYHYELINAISWDWLDTKFLRFNFDRARDIASSITRVPKFVERGMICTRKEMSKMIEHLLTKSELTAEIKAVQGLINNRGY